MPPPGMLLLLVVFAMRRGNERKANPFVIGDGGDFGAGGLGQVANRQPDADLAEMF
jgi:hypothetical protein